MCAVIWDASRGSIKTLIGYDLEWPHDSKILVSLSLYRHVWSCAFFYIADTILGWFVCSLRCSDCLSLLTWNHLLNGERHTGLPLNFWPVCYSFICLSSLYLIYNVYFDFMAPFTEALFRTRRGRGGNMGNGKLELGSRQVMIKSRFLI